MVLLHHSLTMVTGGQEASRVTPILGPKVERESRASMADPGTRVAMADSEIREAMAELPPRPWLAPPRPLQLEPHYPPQKNSLGEVEAGSVWRSGGAGTRGTGPGGAGTGRRCRGSGTGGHSGGAGRPRRFRGAGIGVCSGLESAAAGGLEGAGAGLRESLTVTLSSLWTAGWVSCKRRPELPCRRQAWVSRRWRPWFPRGRRAVESPERRQAFFPGGQKASSDSDRTFPRHRKTPSLQLSPMVSGRSTGAMIVGPEPEQQIEGGILQCRRCRRAHRNP